MAQCTGCLYHNQWLFNGDRCDLCRNQSHKVTLMDYETLEKNYQRTVTSLEIALKQRNAVTNMLQAELCKTLYIRPDTVSVSGLTPGQFAELIQSACGFIYEKEEK